ncbi:hypothetical protein [Tolypothrix sp. VBCCA 56010]|uniref:hypothetical protein n=1 Tax=Tolypothrix sp. VBCCA 56010 TaxID=3137731 RepID=UPI003D7DA2D5
MKFLALGIGWAHFWNIDQGILGFGKPKGHIEDLEELRKRDGVYVRPMPRELYDRWGHWLPEIPLEIRNGSKALRGAFQSRISPKSHQRKQQGIGEMNGECHQEKLEYIV